MRKYLLLLIVVSNTYSLLAQVGPHSKAGDFFNSILLAAYLEEQDSIKNIADYGSNLYNFIISNNKGYEKQSPDGVFFEKIRSGKDLSEITVSDFISINSIKRVPSDSIDRGDTVDVLRVELVFFKDQRWFKEFSDSGYLNIQLLDLLTNGLTSLRIDSIPFLEKLALKTSEIYKIGPQRINFVFSNYNKLGIARCWTYKKKDPRFSYCRILSAPIDTTRSLVTSRPLISDVRKGVHDVIEKLSGKLGHLFPSSKKIYHTDEIYFTIESKSFPAKTTTVEDEILTILKEYFCSHPNFITGVSSIESIKYGWAVTKMKGLVTKNKKAVEAFEVQVIPRFEDAKSEKQGFTLWRINLIGSLRGNYSRYSGNLASLDVKTIRADTSMELSYPQEVNSQTITILGRVKNYLVDKYDNK